MIIPEDIKNDKTVNKYILFKKDGKDIELAVKRVENDKDKPAIYERGEIVKDGEYYGEWVDITEEVRAEYREKKIIKPIKTAKGLDPKCKMDELLRAQELLAELLKAQNDLQ